MAASALAASAASQSMRNREILDAVGTTAAALSLVGSSFIVLCYLFRELRKFSFKLVYFLAVAESEACGKQKIQVSKNKRTLGNASESSRSKKAARTTDPKVSKAKRKDKSKMSRRNNSPIASGPHVSGSSMVNMLARRNAQSKLKSPSSNAISPIPGHHTPASLHDLSPAPPTHGNSVQH